MVVLYTVWEGQCNEALLDVTAVGRMGWKLPASLIIYALAKQRHLLRWLAPDNFWTRQENKVGDYDVVHQLRPKNRETHLTYGQTFLV